MEQTLTENLRKEPLGRLSIYVSDEHTFGTDAVLLADFAGAKKAKKATDIGTGCGIIPLLLIKNGTAAEVDGVEIQSRAVEICNESIKLNGLESSFRVHCLDMKEIKGKLTAGAYDLVTCNPPYKAKGAGDKNLNEAAKIARHETLCVFEDVVKAAAYILKFGGRLCICHRPERLADVICDMRANGIEPKLLREVIQREGESPWLVLVEGRLGGKKGMKVLPPLYVEKDGLLTDEMMKIYGDYKQGKGRRI